MKEAGTRTSAKAGVLNGTRMETATTATLREEKLMEKVFTHGRTEKYMMASGSWD